MSCLKGSCCDGSEASESEEPEIDAEEDKAQDTAVKQRKKAGVPELVVDALFHHQMIGFQSTEIGQWL